MRRWFVLLIVVLVAGLFVTVHRVSAQCGPNSQYPCPPEEEDQPEACGDRNNPCPPPSVTLECRASPATGSAPLSVQFEASPTGGTGEYEFRWDFGDGPPGSAEQNPKHKFDRAETYDVVVGVTSPPGAVGPAAASAYCRLTVTATEAPTPTAVTVIPLSLQCAANPKSGPAPLNVKFESSPDGGDGVYDIGWDFGDGSPQAVEQSPVHAYDSPGTYSVVVRVTSQSQDSGGSSPGATPDCRLMVTVLAAETLQNFPAPVPVSPTSDPPWLFAGLAGLGLAGIGIGLLLVRDSGGYIGPHEVGHAALSSADEYVESGFSSGRRGSGFGLLAGGGLLAVGALLGILELVPDSSWAGLVGIASIAMVVAGAIAAIRGRRRLTVADDPRLTHAGLSSEGLEDDKRRHEEDASGITGQIGGLGLHYVDFRDSVPLTRDPSGYDTSLGEINKDSGDTDDTGERDADQPDDEDQDVDE